MQFCTRRRVTTGVITLAALIAAAACNDGSQPTLSSAGAARQSQAAPANERLAKLVALSLRDASVRAQFRAATAGSPVKEGKLLLSAYLRGQGAAMLKAMARAAGTTEADVLALLAQTGPLEMYLPVPEHRAAWTGGENLIVATTLQDHAVPFGVDLNGTPLQLDAETPPATPAVSIVPAESFDAQGQAYRADLRTARMGLRANMNPDGSWTGLWINEVHTSQDFEGWPNGSPEFEFYFANADTREILVCAGESSVEPYAFNMDGTSYSRPFLVAAENEIPDGVNRVLWMYEDDDTRCSIKDDKDYVKLTTDALSNASDAYKAIKKKEYTTAGTIVHVFNALISIKSILSGGDEYVGTSAGLNDAGETATTFQLKDQNRNNQGWISLQWKTDFAH